MVSTVGNILDPSRTSYCAQKHIPVRNRLSDQQAYIQQLEEKNRAKKQQEEEESKKERYCLEEFKNVKSRVWDKVEENKSATPHEYKRKSAGQALARINVPKPMKEAEDVEAPAKPAQKSVSNPARRSIDCHNENYATKKQAPGKNYFKENIKNMRQQEAEAKVKNAPPPPPKKEKLGVVPEYLTKRKQQWDDEKMKKELEQQMEEELAKIPPGTRPVGDEERQQLLADLKKAYEVEVKRLNSFRI